MEQKKKEEDFGKRN